MFSSFEFFIKIASRITYALLTDAKFFFFFLCFAAFFILITVSIAQWIAKKNIKEEKEFY